MNVDYLNQINEKDLVNYALLHLLKYCDAEIGGEKISDYKVFLMSLDLDSLTLLESFHRGFTVEEWTRLMERMTGPIHVQFFLDYYSMRKITEGIREYNKENLFTNLWMFRFLNLRPSN